MSTHNKDELYKQGLSKDHLRYPLVNVYITNWKISIFHGKTHYQWPFSIAILTSPGRVNWKNAGDLFRSDSPGTIWRRIWRPNGTENKGVASRHTSLRRVSTWISRGVPDVSWVNKQNNLPTNFIQFLEDSSFISRSRTNIKPLSHGVLQLSPLCFNGAEASSHVCVKKHTYPRNH